MNSHKQHPASYRDPAGFIFEQEGKFYRQVNKSYADDYALFMKSGLYDTLAKEKKILAHTELNENLTGTASWHTTLLPDQLAFVSYPYEWGFSQWKDAALLTLELVKKGIAHGMILKDATPFNIQFVNGLPVLIDSLSFEKYDPSKPWVAYRQFTECFAAPLVLARYRSAGLLKMFQLYPDGIPLKLVSKLLPFKTKFNANIFLHIHMQGIVSGGRGSSNKKEIIFSKEKLLNIINSLYSFIDKLVLPPVASQWNNYYEETILSQQYADAKLEIVRKWLREIPAGRLLDIGCNTGMFAMEAAAAGKFTVAIDADEACIENLYITCRQKNITNLVPLCVDIVNPSPAIGWNNKERSAFTERGKTDIVMALALVHHLVLTKNIPLSYLASFFYSLTNEYLIIEFVPLTDPKAQKLTERKSSIQPAYDISLFEFFFSNYFVIIDSGKIPNSNRIIYKMRKK